VGTLLGHGQNGAVQIVPGELGRAPPHPSEDSAGHETGDEWVAGHAQHAIEDRSFEPIAQFE
jgi:hypothetical protein